jgi:hypothetical protein
MANKFLLRFATISFLDEDGHDLAVLNLSATLEFSNKGKDQVHSTGISQQTTTDRAKTILESVGRRLSQTLWWWCNERIRAHDLSRPMPHGLLQEPPLPISFHRLILSRPKGPCQGPSATPDA